MKKVKIVLLLLLFATVAYADPSPFGLEINKSTVNDLKNKYEAEFNGINRYTEGEMYLIPPSQVDLEGVEKITAIFSKEGILQVILVKMSKSRFDEIYDILRSKYRLVESEIPFVGNKSAEFEEGNSLIKLEAPHLSFEMSLIYMSKEFYKIYKRTLREEENMKRKKEKSAL